MGTFTKIKTVGLTKMNNAEYLNYMIRSRKNIPKANKGDVPDDLSTIDKRIISRIGVEDHMLDAFDADCALMAELVNQSRISDATAKMSGTDKQRNKLIVHFTSTVSEMRNSPVASIEIAANSLYNTIKSYIGIYKIASQQKTQKIKGLLLDVSTAENAAKVTLLTLTPTIEELRIANDLYAELSNQRTNQRATLIKDTSVDIRKRLDSLYDDMITLAFVQSIATPTEETEAFIRNQNALIDEVTALYNQRTAAAKPKKPSNEAPDDL